MPSQPDPTSIMDLDFPDFDSAWFFDQISASSNFNPSPDQISPPISAFADFSHDKSSVASAAIRISPDCRDMTCKPGAATDNRQDDGEDDKKRLRYPVNGMARLEVPDMFIIKERMTQALRYFKESTEHQILAQVWAPVKSGSRNVLTTSGQPFILSPHSNGLHQYRTASLMYSFSLDGETDGSLGLPGRVFRQKLPEWTPDVQYYSSKEYPRVKHAKNYNVHGTLALPVFEPSGQSCVGVLELIMTAKKINYAPEVDKVCKALEAVNLRSSEILDHPNVQICNEGRQNALSEILEVLTEVCEAYKLPLAQTWVPCRHRNVLAYGGGLKKSCSSFDGSCRDQVCMSTTDAAFYVVDAHMWGFREACAEHHLQKGQGVAGKAFSSHGSCFCEAINRFSKREYPLVHYARMFGLAGSFSICLRSKYTGDDEYVLEFFLPPSLTERMPHHTFLDTILVTMKRHFRSLMVASGRTLEEERKFTEMVDVPMDENDSDIEPILGLYPSKPVSMQEPSNGGVMAPLKTCTQFMEEKDVEKRKNSPGTGPTGGNCNGISSAKDKESIKSSEKKRGKAEKQISFEVLQQYFAGSLKDAAKSLGVCPTTMKRICRQHGIPRWPSRKINKVNRSLSKLKRVIESVQGADGAFSLSNLSPTSVPGGSISWPAGLKGGSQQPSQCSKPIEFTYERIDLPGRTGAVAKDWQAETTVNSRGSCHEEEAHKQNGFVRGFQVSRAGSGSREASTATSTSHGSCQGSPATESTVPLNQFIPSFHEVVGNSLSLMFQPKGETNLSAGFTLPDAVFKSVAREPFGSILAEDASSSKDLRNLCSSIADVNVDEGIPEQGSANPPFTLSPVNTMLPRSGAGQDMRSVTIKATFREDIIRFRFCLHSNIVDLRDEVAKRFKIDIGTFEVKYLDDDNEWVLIACESDLQECLDIMRSSGSSIIRLSIHDMLGNPGSSCESSGG